MVSYDLEKIAREERNRYSREWARAHPESRKETQHKYWLRKAQERLERETDSHVGSNNYTASPDDKEPGRWMVTKNGERYVGGIVSQTEAFKILDAIWESERKGDEKP